jgi:hypothetical protein
LLETFSHEDCWCQRTELKSSLRQGACRPVRSEISNAIIRHDTTTYMGRATFPLTIFTAARHFKSVFCNMDNKNIYNENWKIPAARQQFSVRGRISVTAANSRSLKAT